MTARELIALLKEHDPETEVKMDYGGTIEDIEYLYEDENYIYVG